MSKRRGVLRLALVGLALATPMVSACAAAGAEVNCSCSHVEAMQKEMREFLTRREQHRQKASELREIEKDRMYLEAARRIYDDWEKKLAKGGSGAADAGTGTTTSYQYVPLGNSAGIEDYSSLKGDVWVADQAKFSQKEAEWVRKNRGQSLCDDANDKKLDAFAAAGSACAAIKQSVLDHEKSHRQTCKSMGYMKFSSRNPSEKADDEVLAYGVGIKTLETALRQVLADKNTKVTSGAPGATTQSLLNVKVTCAMGFRALPPFKGVVCDLDEPFTLAAISQNDAPLEFTPTHSTGGNVRLSWVFSGGGFTAQGAGTYTVAMSGEQAATITLRLPYTVHGPTGSFRHNDHPPMKLVAIDKGGQCDSPAKPSVVPKSRFPNS